MNAFNRKHQRSNEQRELSLLAYLSQLQSPDPEPVQPLHSLTPYQVDDEHRLSYSSFSVDFIKHCGVGADETNNFTDNLH